MTRYWEEHLDSYGRTVQRAETIGSIFYRFLIHYLDVCYYVHGLNRNKFKLRSLHHRSNCTLCRSASLYLPLTTNLRRPTSASRRKQEHRTIKAAEERPETLSNHSQSFSMSSTLTFLE